MAVLLLGIFIGPLGLLKALTWTVGRVRLLIPDQSRIEADVLPNEQWSQDAQHLYYISGSKRRGFTLRRYDVKTQRRKSLARITVPNPLEAPSFAISPDERRLFLCYADRVIYLDLTSGATRTLYRTPKHTSLGSISWLTDGRLVCSTMTDDGHRRIFSLTQQGSADQGIAVRQHGLLRSVGAVYLIQDDENQQLLVCDSLTGSVRSRIPISRLASRPFDVILATPNTVYLWYYNIGHADSYVIDRIDYSTGESKITHLYTLHETEYYAVALAPDHTHLALLTGGGTEWPTPAVLHMYSFSDTR